jgi:hypothetical protein
MSDEFPPREELARVFRRVFLDNEGTPWERLLPRDREYWQAGIDAVLAMIREHQHRGERQEDGEQAIHSKLANLAFDLGRGSGASEPESGPKGPERADAN